jgi:hypothetical protein
MPAAARYHRELFELLMRRHFVTLAAFLV